jgi:hypothetical protein
MRDPAQLAITLGVLTLACWLLAGVVSVFGGSLLAARLIIREKHIGMIALALNLLGASAALAMAVTLVMR